MTVHFGDCREVMRDMIARGDRAQMCVTSPPYFGLRDYGTGKWVGGDPDCDHSRCQGGTANSTLGEKSWGNGMSEEALERNNRASWVPYKVECPKCGAVRVDRQLGLEETPQEFVDNLVDVFGLVWDILEEDGTLWLNLGDSYAGAPGGYQGKNGQRASRTFTARIDHDKRGNGFKAKDLMGMPWRVAFALQEWGWYLRQDIIWHKPNPMPESVRDRCTKAHEYIFLLSKSPQYYFDHEAFKEPVASDRAPTRKAKSTGVGHASLRPGSAPYTGEEVNRNRHSVWTVSSKPYRGAHFAVYPPDLIEPCVLAGSQPGATVLDPFFGSGTTGQVCNNLGRNYIGIELNKDYEPLQLERTAQQGLQI